MIAVAEHHKHFGNGSQSLSLQPLQTHRGLRKARRVSVDICRQFTNSNTIYSLPYQGQRTDLR